MGAAPGVAPVRSRYATLTVTVRPEPPVILEGALIRTQEDRVTILECVSRGGKPAAEVTIEWWWWRMYLLHAFWSTFALPRVSFEFIFYLFTINRNGYCIVCNNKPFT